MAAHRKVVQPNIVVTFLKTLPAVAYPLAAALLVQTVLLLVMARPNHAAAWVGSTGLLLAVAGALFYAYDLKRKLRAALVWVHTARHAAPSWFRVQAYRWGRPS